MANINNISQYLCDPDSIVETNHNSNNYHYKDTDIFNDIDPDLNFMLSHIEDQCVNYDIESFKKKFQYSNHNISMIFFSRIPKE